MDKTDKNSMDITRRPIGFEIRRIDNVIMRYIRSRLIEAGFDEVTTMHGWILGYLAKNQGRRINQKDFEKSFGIARSTVTNILKLMEKKGYITRTSDENDSRCKLIELTEKGKRVHEETIRIIDSVEQQIERGIDDEDREALRKITVKLVGNLGISAEEFDSYDPRGCRCKE